MSVSVSFTTDLCLEQCTDEELVFEYKRTGDYICFEELVRRYRPILIHFLSSRYSVDYDQIEDAIQATFARVWQKIEQFDNTRPLRPWVYRIAISQMVNLRREIQRNFTFISLDSSVSSDEDGRNWASEIVGREVEPYVEFAKLDSAMEVRCALSKLPLRFRQVLELVFFQGLTRQRVAETLNLTVSAVSRRVTRALELLRDSLARSHRSLIGGTGF